MSSFVAAVLGILAGGAFALTLVPLLRTCSAPVAAAGAGLIVFGVALLALKFAAVASLAHLARRVGEGPFTDIRVDSPVWTAGAATAALPTAGLFAAVALIAVLDRSRAR